MAIGYFHETEYYIYNELVNGEVSMLILPDLHYSNLISQERLDWIARKIEESNADYVLFCGDSVDSVDDYDEQFYLFMRRVSCFAQGLVSFGSHDYWKYIYDDKGQSIDGDYYLAEFWDRINKYVRVLDNASYEDDKIFVTGFTQSKKYYYPEEVEKDKKEIKGLFHPIPEDENQNKLELEQLLNKTTIPKDKPSILSAHAPTYFFTSAIQMLSEPYTLVACGHTHNGSVIPGINEVWRSTYGFMTPDRRLLQKNVRNTLGHSSYKVAVCEPVTMFSKSTRLGKFNPLLPIGFTKVIFTNNKDYQQDKIITKRWYSVAKRY